jgi:hypothetical protein
LDLCEKQGVVLDGGAPHFGATLLGQTDGDAMIEIIGSQNIVIQNINIYGSDTDTPSVGIITSRSDTAQGVNSHTIRYDNVQFGGYFTQTPVYIVESESNYFHICNWYTIGGTMTTGALLSRANVLAVAPVHATMGDHGYGLFNINFDRCQMINPDGARAIHIHDGAGDVHIHDSYLYSATNPTIEIEGGATLYCSHVSCEGTPDKTVYLNYDAGAATNVCYLYFDSFAFGSPTTHSLYADDSITLRASRFTSCTPGISGGNAMPVRLWVAEGCDFTGLSDYRSGIFNILFDSATGYSTHCKFRLELEDTLTYAGGAYSNYDIVENWSVATAEKLEIPGLKFVGATIVDIKSTTSVWDIGSLADGASQNTAVALAGVAIDGAWVAWASVTSLDVNGWAISAYPYGGGVYVTVTNHTGGVLDPAAGATLRVVAMKVA